MWIVAYHTKEGRSHVLWYNEYEKAEYVFDILRKNDPSVEQLALAEVKHIHIDGIEEIDPKHSAIRAWLARLLLR